MGRHLSLAAVERTVRRVVHLTFRAILFDFDFTLSDSTAGAVECTAREDEFAGLPRLAVLGGVAELPAWTRQSSPMASGGREPTESLNPERP